MRRHLHNGRHLVGSESTVPLHQRLWQQIDMSGGLLACWPWLGAKSKKRAGTVRGHIQDRATRKHYLAHRLALCFAGEGLSEYTRPEHAAHRCHNRLCCNTYSHLYWASDGENRNDRHALEQRQAKGLPVWEPMAWYLCDACGKRELKVYLVDGAYFCQHGTILTAMWTLADL